jgi:hypothetical protein
VKRWLIIVGAMGATIFATASGAGASVSFNPQTWSGTISRGELIAHAGKDGLVPDPMVSFTTTQDFTETCTFEDGSSVQASGTHYVFVLFRAETTYAPGKGNITGYTLSPSDVVDGDTSQPGQDRGLCWAARGLSDDGSEVTQTYDLGPWVSTLTFFGPNGGVELPFVTAGASTQPQ